jgi:hypothetical protein
MPGTWTTVPGFKELLKSPLGAPQAPPPLQIRVEILRQRASTKPSLPSELQPNYPRRDGRILAGGGTRDPEIIAVIKERNIKGLVHFTPMDNVESILTLGLVPRRELEVLAQQNGTSFAYTDPHRYDGKESTCLSVCFPNAEMFYRKRCDNRGSKWVVLVLAPEDILCHPDTRFSVGNAAQAGAERLSGATGFRRLYEDSPTYRKRPRDPQAEVRVPRTIHPGLIKYICCEREDHLPTVRAATATAGTKCNMVEGVTVVLAPQYFGKYRRHSDAPYS